MTDKQEALTPKVDTGFNGVLGITSQTIQSLNLEPEGLTTIITAAGPQKTQFYRIVLSIPQTSLIGMHAVVLQTVRPVIGCAVLNLATWLYDGLNHKWCIISDQGNSSFK